MANRRRTNPRVARARHLHQVEAAVRQYSPEIWTATRRLHARWLREALAAARPLLDRLVIEGRLYELEIDYLASQLEWLGYEISPEELMEQPEVAWALNRITSTAPRQAGFLDRDPRMATLVRETTRILDDDLSSYWQSLTNPRTLARRLVQQKADGVPYIEAAKQIAREYGTEFYRAERLVRSSYNSASNNANLAAIEEAGFQNQRWLTARDARVRRPEGSNPFDHRAADGQIVRTGQPFIVSGEQLRYPGDRSMGASAGNIINCRCTVIGVE